MRLIRITSTTTSASVRIGGNDGHALSGRAEDADGTTEGVCGYDYPQWKHWTTDFQLALLGTKGQVVRHTVSRLTGMSRKKRLQAIIQSMDKFHYQFKGVHMVVINAD